MEGHIWPRIRRHFEDVLHLDHRATMQVIRDAKRLQWVQEVEILDLYIKGQCGLHMAWSKMAKDFKGSKTWWPTRILSEALPPRLSRSPAYRPIKQISPQSYWHFYLGVVFPDGTQGEAILFPDFVDNNIDCMDFWMAQEDQRTSQDEFKWGARERRRLSPI